jgi:hypothetical protein
MNKGEVVESGPATQVSDSLEYWSYKAKTTLTSNVMIEVVAKDHPGGATVKQFPFPNPSNLPSISSSLDCANGKRQR